MRFYTLRTHKIDQISAFLVVAEILWCINSKTPHVFTLIFLYTMQSYTSNLVLTTLKEYKTFPIAHFENITAVAHTKLLSQALNFQVSTYNMQALYKKKHYWSYF